jgi:hypothetical protein
MIRIRLWCIDRAHSNALGFVKMPFALDAFVRVNQINGIAFSYRLYRALWFAKPTGGALFINFKSHDNLLVRF